MVIICPCLVGIGVSSEASVTTVFVWFLASQFLDVGGAVQLHAPPSYEHLGQAALQFLAKTQQACCAYHKV